MEMSRTYVNNVDYIVASPWSQWYHSKWDGHISSSPEGRCSEWIITQRDGRSYLACLSPLFMPTFKGKQTGITHTIRVGVSINVGSGCYILRNKAASAWSWSLLPSNAEILNAWKFTSVFHTTSLRDVQTQVYSFTQSCRPDDKGARANRYEFRSWKKFRSCN